MLLNYETYKKFDYYCNAHDCETCPIHKNGKCAYLCGVKDGHFTEELFQEIMGYTPFFSKTYMARWSYAKLTNKEE